MDDLLLKSKRAGGFMVLEAAGRVDSRTSPQLDQYLAELMADGERQLLLDLQAVDYLSSAALRVLLATEKKLSATGGKLVLSSLQPHVVEVFALSGFGQLFHIADSKESFFESTVPGIVGSEGGDTVAARNKKVVLKYIMLVQLCQYDDLAGVMSEGLEMSHSPSMNINAMGSKVTSAADQRAFLENRGRDVEIELKSMIAEGEVVAVHNITTQTYEDGRKTSTPWMSFYTLEGGKIIKAVHVVDRLHEQQQLAV